MTNIISFSTFLNILKRIDTRITDEVLANAFDLSTTTIQRWRSGKNHSRNLPNAFTTNQVESAIDKLCKNFFGGDDDKLIEELLFQLEEYYDTDYWTNKYNFMKNNNPRVRASFYKELIG